MIQKPDTVKTVYFLGIGGIGMSALARYFRYQGYEVHGYDRTETTLTRQMHSEGMNIHYEDRPDLIPDHTQLVVYTPAIPQDLKELQFIRSKQLPLLKRAEVLGKISEDFSTIAIAGTHGKTTTSTLTAHLLKQSHLGCSAFLGGISKNYDTNLLLSQSRFLVAEADEFDRSFLHLHPSVAVVTSMDADHLDIYHTHDELKSAFNQFAGNILPEGSLIHKKGLPLLPSGNRQLNVYTYAVEAEADFAATNIVLKDGLYHFNFEYPGGTIKDLVLGLPGLFNVENAVAAIAACRVCGVTENEIRSSLQTFSGVKRRFEVRVRTGRYLYIDDYAHHPAELRACINSARLMFPEKRLTGIFQPHLYSRTRDFADSFAESLGLLDEVILLPIYPAREIPIPGIDSQWLLEKIRNPRKILLEMDEVTTYLRNHPPEVLLTMGAGNIELLARPIENLLTEQSPA